MRLECSAAAAAVALTLLAAAASAAAQPAPCEGTPSATKLTILVENVRSERGLMTATLYPADKHRFLAKDGALAVWRQPAAAPVTSLCIWLTAPGPYSIAIYQDLTSVHHFIHNPFPAVPYGFSNNPHIAFGPPSYESTLFDAAAGETVIHVRLHNP